MLELDCLVIQAIFTIGLTDRDVTIVFRDKRVEFFFFFIMAPNLFILLYIC